jgi:hypothetical protein
MDKVRSESRIDQAIATFGVDGSGVIVALIDRGIDWKNNDFRNEDGTTRIKYIFDLSDNSGANKPENKFGIGTIYSESQINTALQTGKNLTTRDAVGHGTTTAGISTGNGRNSVNRKYRGVAPKAFIIAVKITGGAPAHNDQPAEEYFYSQDLLLTAIDFVLEKAAELKLPVVMLPNVGSIGGPTDGTSRLSRKIDSEFRAERKGMIFVNGSGDEGGGANRASATIKPGETISLEIEKAQPGRLRFNLWYPIKSPNEIGLDFTIRTPTGSIFGPYASVTSEEQRDTRATTGVFTYYHNGRNKDFFLSTSQKREVLIDLIGPIGTYKIDVKRPSETTSNQAFIATLNFSNYAQKPQNRFKNYNISGNIWDGATAFNNICPGSYNISNTWTDIDGFNRSSQGEGAIGNIWLGSSIGPTFDGRMGVDLCSPGDSLFTVYAPNSYWATFRFNMIKDGNGFYGRASAVSAAAPIVTGIIALMLQANPELDQIQVRNILRSTARADVFTGKIPNNTWGYGKVDAYEAVRQARLSRTLPPDVSLPIFTSQPSKLSVVAGASATFSISATGTNLNYQWNKNGMAINGATRSTYTIASAQTSDTGSYTVTVSNGDGAVTSDAATLTVSPPPPSITSQPENLSVITGSSARFSVTATGINLTYQWHKNGSAIKGATGPSFNISSVKPTDAGNYTVTIANSAGRVTSTVAMLTVNAPKITSNLSAQTLNLNVFSSRHYTLTTNFAATSYTSSRLPAGLNLNSLTGIISGKPTGKGTHTVTFTAIKQQGTKVIQSATAQKVFKVN